MLSIRFLRTGKKNQPFYRMVVTDKKNPPKGGRFLEIVGFLNPFTKEKQIKADRVKYWISVGAKPSDTVNNLLIQEKIIEGEKVAVHGKPKKKAVEAKAKVEAEKNQPKEPAKEASAPETETEFTPETEKSAEDKKETPAIKAKPEPEVTDVAPEVPTTSETPAEKPVEEEKKAK